jgi:hypothetical protein
VPLQPAPVVPVVPPVVVDATPVADGAGWAAFADLPVVEAAGVMEVLSGDDTEETEPEPQPEPEPEPVPVPAAEAPVEPAVVADPEPEPVGEATAEIEATDPVEPSVVRDLDPWERGFDETIGGKGPKAPLPQ